VQLLRVILYNGDGRTRKVDFDPGSLNIVVGNSRTGKSALLDIVDYCMGQDDAPAFPGIIGHTSVWVGTLWHVGAAGRVFVGRPRPKRGKATSTLACLRVGGTDLEEPALADLEANVSSDQLREQLGAFVGLNDVKVARSDEDGAAMSVTLGTASVFSFQNQDEIASKSQLFHRATDPQLRRRLQDAFPFFLGAVTGDQAKLLAELRGAEHNLRRQENDLARTLEDADRTDNELRGLVQEAYSVGLLSGNVASAENRRLVLELLGTALQKGSQPEEIDDTAPERVKRLRDEQQVLRRELSIAMENRSLVLDASSGASGYASAIAHQAGRLQSLQLVGDVHDGSERCPVCNQDLPGVDPVPTQLAERLRQLRSDIGELTAATPGRQRALSELHEVIAGLRDALATVDASLVSMRLADPSGGERLGDAASRNFVRGRIDATLRGARPIDEEAMRVLEDSVSGTKRRVDALKEALNAEGSKDLLASLVNLISVDITKFAARLGVEHADHHVRLDLNKLTVVADTIDGPKALKQMGSGGNWVGYHIAAHLALHKFFVQQGRPLPPLLMLDQPSQPFSEGKQRTGNTDPDAVRRVFELLRELSSDLAPGLQIILCEHVELDDEWFRSAIRESWRGEGLIPRDWADEETWQAFEPVGHSSSGDTEGLVL
jgi:hypothetical protein